MAQSLMTRRPFFPISEQMSDLMSRFWGEDGNGSPFAGALAPSVDVSETDTAIEVTLDVPGCKAEELDIQLNNNLLTIRGERKEESEEKGKTFHRIERRTGSFSRSVALPCEVSAGEAAAECRDGVLTITLPKSEGSKSQKIQIKG